MTNPSSPDQGKPVWLPDGALFVCEFVVTPARSYSNQGGGVAYLVDGPQALLEASPPMLGSGCFEDDNWNNVPKAPGLYRAIVLYEFHEGYSEGYRAPGEDDWEFTIQEAVRIDRHTDEAAEWRIRFAQHLAKCEDVEWALYEAAMELQIYRDENTAGAKENQALRERIAELEAQIKGGNGEYQQALANLDRVGRLILKGKEDPVA